MEALNDKQILVARYDATCTSCRRRGQNQVVVRIAANWLGQCARRNQFQPHSQECYCLVGFLGGVFELPRPVPAQFAEDMLGRDQLMMQHAVFEQVGTNAT